MTARALLTCVVALSFCLPASAADEEAPQTKILLIGHKPDHPFGTHMYLEECELLARCLERTPGVQTTVSNGWPQDAEATEGVDAIVFYSSPAGDILLKGDHAEQAEKLLASGVGYTAIHWATGCRDKELGPKYLKILGGWFDTSFAGLKTTKSRLRQASPDHAVCRGWEEYDLRDEFYLDLRFQPEAKPVLQVEVQGKGQTVAWVYERPDSGDGRSFGTTLGHFHDNFRIEAFRRAIVNGILWTAHRDVPNHGAPVDVPPEALELKRPKPKK